MNPLINIESIRAGEELEMAAEVIKPGLRVVVTHRRSPMFGELVMVSGERRQFDRHDGMYTSAWQVRGSRGVDWIPVGGVRLGAHSEGAVLGSLPLIPESVEV